MIQRLPDERTKRMGADATSCQHHTGQSEFFVPVLRLQTLKKIDFIPIYIDRALTTSRSLSLRHSHFQTGWQPYLLCPAVFRLFTGLITNSNRLPTQTVTLVPVWGVLNLSSGYRHSIFSGQIARTHFYCHKRGQFYCVHFIQGSETQRPQAVMRGHRREAGKN